MVRGIDLLVHAVPEPGLLPVVVEDADPTARLGRTHPGVVVLHSAVDVVGIPIVDADGVELADREVVDLAEIHAPVVRLPETGVPREVQMVRVTGVDPERVVVGVYTHVVCGRLGDLRKASSAVFTLVCGRSEHVHTFRVRGVDEDLRVVHGPRVEPVDSLPRVAPVLAAVGTLLGS